MPLIYKVNELINPSPTQRHIGALNLHLFFRWSPKASWHPKQAWLYRGCLDDLEMKQALFALLVIATATPSAMAQKEIPKAPGHDQCPLGYVNTLGTTCVSPIYYEVAPTNGKACKSGWMNIGAGYCKKKTLGIF